MKRNNLFKAVGITILVFVLLSWIVPIVYSIAGIKLAGEETVSTQIGFISLINVILETFSGFGTVVLFILLVGALYGALKATGAYDKIVDFLAEKASGKEKCALITIIIVMALISSIGGLDLGLLVVFPLLFAFVVKMGYDKMVALSATVGSTLVGMYGATFAGTMYGTNNNLLELGKYSQIIPKCVLLVLGLAALLFFIIKYCEAKKLVFDKESANKALLIEGIVLFVMAFAAGSSVLISEVLAGTKLLVTMIVLASVSLVAASALMFFLTKNIWKALTFLFSVALLFSLIILIPLTLRPEFSVLWVVAASVSLVGLVVSVFMLTGKNVWRALILLFSLIFVFSSIMLIPIILKSEFNVLWVAAASVSLVGLVVSVFMLTGKNIWKTLLSLFCLVFAFSLALAIGFATQSVVSILWIVLASVSFVAVIGLIVKLILDCKKTKAASKKSKTVVAKKSTVVKVRKSNKSEKGVLPALVIMGILLLVIFLGTTSWGDIFKSNWFEKAHTSWTGLKIGEFALLAKLFGGLEALGSWNTINRFQSYSVLIVLAIVALKFAYKTKWVDVFADALEELKKYVVPALLAVLAYSVFVLAFYNKFFATVTNNLIGSGDFNVVKTGIYTILNSVVYSDYYYLANSLLYDIKTVYNEVPPLSVISVMFTNLYSLVMLIAPTSVLLLVSLSLSDVKYTEWVKFIWKLVLALFILSFVVFTIMVLV